MPLVSDKIEKNVLFIEQVFDQGDGQQTLIGRIVKRKRALPYKGTTQVVVNQEGYAPGMIYPLH